MTATDKDELYSFIKPIVPDTVSWIEVEEVLAAINKMIDRKMREAYRKGKNDNLKWCNDFIEAHGGLADAPTSEANKDSREPQE